VKEYDRIVKSARRQADCCRNIESTVTVKISNCSKLRRVTNPVASMWLQAAVRIAKKDRHIVRCIVKYQEIWRSVAVQVTGFEVIADPKIFQNTRTGLRSYRLKGSVTITQSRRNRVGAEGLLLHYHPDIEQTVAIKIAHFELVRPCRADDRGSKREVSVPRKHSHTRWQGSYNVDVAIAGYLRQSQAVRQ